MRENRFRNIQINLRLTAAEREELRRKAGKTGLPQSIYLRMLIHGQRPKELPPLEYYQLMRQLLAIGNSLNQIAARANATGFFLADEYKKNAQELQKTLLEIKAEMTQPERM